MPEHVAHVLRMASPLEVSDPVVSGITVHVPHFFSRTGFTNERQRDLSMRLLTMLHAIYVHPELIPPDRMPRLREHQPDRRTRPGTGPSDLAQLRNRIVIRCSRKRTPLVCVIRQFAVDYQPSR
jgi:hypothetical protein